MTPAVLLGFVGFCWVLSGFYQGFIGFSVGSTRF